ncbi:hypothetical protein A2755_03350 [Candidatus Wolfebacteria bacterium RIFCSPHIGHO2_01_FULL_48_22]|uniref:Membrane insertase YidC/Oxa/ALB C-terminal domain-containing protein n=2 Tax=Candidatus Wolfeibacteriota TaxID=1752735 RepID=A0A1F8DPK4_9BACT|nr:MAG: hypothetical protein A2755_03350 [Candidatus Wolfebacteria bacterium RIFCSPHIGHO2_01_FULL_48_22]OGM92063.1 MAG: hypothetical protein A2935_01840 [Candidatus Wolfebacteria bacterium RIFCSPLOWO2_01_FULL_47_17b]
MSFLFNEILYKPLLNLLILIYDLVVSDFGVSIILITVLIRFVLLPIFYKSAKDQTILQKIAPQIREIQKKHKENKEEQVRQMMAVYKEHRVNPFSSILLLIIQLPILFALYRVFVGGLPEAGSDKLYSFVHLPEVIHYTFLGFIDLSSPFLALVIITALAQFTQSWLLLRVAKKRAPNPAAAGDNPAIQAAERMSHKMIYFMPVVTAIILFNLPAAVALYWFTTSVFSAIQQLAINKKIREKEIISNA